MHFPVAAFDKCPREMEPALKHWQLLFAHQGFKTATWSDTTRNRCSIDKVKNTVIFNLRLVFVLNLSLFSCIYKRLHSKETERQKGKRGISIRSQIKDCLSKVLQLKSSYFFPNQLLFPSCWWEIFLLLNS